MYSITEINNDNFNVYLKVQMDALSQMLTCFDQTLNKWHEIQTFCKQFEDFLWNMDL